MNTEITIYTKICNDHLKRVYNDCPYCEIDRLKAENERIKNRFFRTDAIAARYRKTLERIIDEARVVFDAKEIAREALQGQEVEG